MVELSSLSILWEPWLYVLGEIGGYQAVALAVPVTLSMLILGALTYFLLKFVVLAKLLEHAGGGGDDKTANWVVGIITVAVTFLSLYSGAALILAGMIQVFGFVYAFLIFFVLMIGLVLAAWKWGKGFKGGTAGSAGGGAAGGGGLFGGGDESAPATDEVATETGEVTDEFAEAGLEDQHLANQAQIENYESAILNEEQKKFQVMKGIRNRIPLMRTQGVNAPDPQYGNKGATLRVVTAGFLKNIINICAVELTQEQKILQFEALNRRKTHIAATRERHEIQLEKHEMKDEKILDSEILRDLRKAPKNLKPLYEQVKKTQLNIEKFEKSRLNLKNRERNMEVAEEKLEKLEEKFSKGFENTLKNTEKEAVRFRNFLLSNANITPQQITNEYRRLDKIMVAASTANVNFLKEQYELLKTEHKKLEFRLVVLKETEEIQRLIAYRDQLLARISQVKGGKNQKLFTQKELKARDRARNLSQKTLQLFARCEKEIAKLNSEVTNAQKELQAAQRELNEFKSIAI